MFETLHTLVMHPHSSYTWSELYEMPIPYRTLAVRKILEEKNNPDTPFPEEVSRKNSKVIRKQEFNPTYSTKISKK